MASPQLVKVIAHLRSLSASEGEAGDLAASRRRVVQYCAVDPVTSHVDAQVVRLDIGGLQAEWLLAEGADPDRRLLYLHGGGWSGGDLDSHRGLSARLSRAAGAAVLAVHYRLVPEHPFPAGLDDCVHAFRWLSMNGPNGAAAAKSLFIAGDSAGGNLTLATLLALRERGIPFPNGAIALSPATDFGGNSESFTTRAAVDPITAMPVEAFRMMGHMYTQGRADPLTPLCSPLYGDLAGLPPLLIQVGDCEALLDDSVRFADKAKAAGVDATLEVWPEMPHVWQLFGGYLPEADEAIARIGAFVRKHG